MTVIIEKPAVNLREELAALRNQGTYQEQQFYFDSLVTNGTFDTDTTGWTAVSDATLALNANRLEVTSNAGFTNGLGSTSISTVVGRVYQISVDVTLGTSASYRIWVGTAASTSSAGNNMHDSGAQTTTQTYEATFTAIATTTYINLVSVDDGGTTLFDNISVFEVDANDDVIHTMPKGWKPKDVFEDGLLQREGAAHDYTVVYDGFDYVVKPAVAPTATTQTCVIGVRA